MVKTFRNKGLKQLFENQRSKAIAPQLADRLTVILDYLDAVENIHDMNVSGLRLHELKGDRKGTWSVTVSGNWRLTVSFIDGDAYDLNLEDYH